MFISWQNIWPRMPDVVEKTINSSPWFKWSLPYAAYCVYVQSVSIAVVYGFWGGVRYTGVAGQHAFNSVVSRWPHVLCKERGPFY